MVWNYTELAQCHWETGTYINFVSCVLNVDGKRIQEEEASSGRDISNFEIGFDE